MEIVPTSYSKNLMRYWRRRRYQRLSRSNNIKRKMNVARLGDQGTRSSTITTRRRRSWRIRRCLTTKLSVLKVVSPARLLAKFHEYYVEMMVGLAGNVAKPNRIFAGKSVAKDKEISVVSSGTEGRLVDSKLLLEIYKRLAASRHLH